MPELCVPRRELIEEDPPFKSIGRFFKQLRHRTPGRLRECGEAIPGLLVDADRGAHDLSLLLRRLISLPKRAR